MSIKAIDYRIIVKRDGQTQLQRMPQWLDPSLVPIDPRSKEDFLNFVKKVAKEINFYDVSDSNNPLTPAGTWEDFFNLTIDELKALAGQASLPPHIALWNTFIELYEMPKQLMNTLTGRHLDFYYEEVLRLKKNGPTADKAHVVFELKKNTSDTLLATGTSLLAGKDTAKKDLHYLLAHDIVVNKSKIAQLKSLYINPNNKNAIHYAPVANSADGLGAETDKANPKWNAFGNTALPLAQIGFCLAADVLRMKEGNRVVTVQLTIRNLPATAKNNALTANLFKISITGEKGWIGPKTVSPTITSSDSKVFITTFSFSLRSDEPAVIGYDGDLHGNNFDTIHPVLQILVNNEKTDFGYQGLANAELIDSTIEVQVTGVKELQLENDLGPLNAKKSFAPFGPAPAENANFFISSEEAFSKRLKGFYFDVEWKNIPAPNLGNYFRGYAGSNTNADFTAIPSIKDGFGWQEKPSSFAVFNAVNAQANSRWSFSNPSAAVKSPSFTIPDIRVKTGLLSGQSLQQKITGKIAQLVPAFASLSGKPVATPASSYKPALQAVADSYDEGRTGSFSLRLQHNFLFKEYPKRYTEEIIRSIKTGVAPDLPGEPFSPEIQSITLNYTAATARIAFNGTSLNDYVNEEIEFFHFGAFGQMREHAYARSQNNFLNNLVVKLLPAYVNEGDFYIGCSGLNANDSACILFQAAEGSANPAKLKVAVKWSVLCDNYWKELTGDDFIFDTTNGFLTSGVIKFVIPPEATTSNTIMPGGLIWLKASIQKDSDAVCSMVDVRSNAAIVLFNNQNNDPSHFAASLPPNTINKLETETAAVKGVKQPFASFEGKMQEDGQAFYTRVSERLRHKERSVALWDYERLILQHFSRVHKVKCINHASGKSFYAPGHLLMIIVPDLTNQNAVNLFQPQADTNTLNEILTFLKAHSGSWVEHHVSNPFYEPVKISVKVRLKKGYEFNYYERIINEKLQAFLSPWVNNPGSDIYFGGKVTKSMIVKFLEGLEFVDFLSDLSLFHSTNNGKSFGGDVEVAEASNPAAILVSNDHHEIFNY